MRTREREAMSRARHFPGPSAALPRLSSGEGLLGPKKFFHFLGFGEAVRVLAPQRPALSRRTTAMAFLFSFRLQFIVLLMR